MKVVIYQTEDTLDPNETCKNPEAFLESFMDGVTNQIKREYPDADVELVKEAYTNRKGDDFNVYADLSWQELELVESDIRDICSNTFEYCCIGFESRGEKTGGEE